MHSFGSHTKCVHIFLSISLGFYLYNRENDLCNFSKPNVQKPRFFARLSGFVFG